jgi:PAS domain S-box-containing protein
MHAARLNLPGPAFRILMTCEEAFFGQDDVPDTSDRLRQLLDTRNICAWEGDAQTGEITYVSQQAIKMLGYPVNAWYEPDFLARHIHDEDRNRVLAAYRKHSRRGESFDLTFRMLTADARVIWIQNLVSFSRRENVPLQMHGFMIDISERQRVEEALKDLGARLIAAQEDERKRVARELHDDLNQRMAVLSIELGQLSYELRSAPEVAKQIQLLQSHAQEISTDIHRLSYQLHPSKLDHLGLATALKSLCDELSRRGRPAVSFYERGVQLSISKDTTLCLYRIAQEALRNCVKHSGASSARVVLTKRENGIVLTVADDGRGFETESEAMEKGLGFISMKERLRNVGGRISIYSRPQAGTRIEVWVPVVDGFVATKQLKFDPTTPHT